MDHRGTNGSADIYLRGKEGNNTAAWCGTTALGSARKTAEKMDPKKKTTMKRLFRAKKKCFSERWKRLSVEKELIQPYDCIFLVSLIDMNLNKRSLDRFQGVRRVV